MRHLQNKSKQFINSRNANFKREVMNIWDNKQWNREGNIQICKKCGNDYESRKCRKCK